MTDSWLNRKMRSTLVWISSNPVSLIGAILATGAAVLFMIFALVYMASAQSINPYFAALGFLGLPVLGLTGGGLVLAGRLIFRERAEEEPFWVGQLNIRNERKALTLFMGSVFAFIVFAAISGMQAANFMDSARFCGETCHSVMEPEAVAHANSSHASIRCVSCHVGEGIEGAFVAKMRGAWQIISLSLDLYERPIPAPVESLPSSEDTCQECHDTSRTPAGKISLYKTFKDDRESSPLVSAIALNVGSSAKGSPAGIHAHGSKDLQIRYYTTDSKREKIAWVEAKTSRGTRSWSMEGETPPVIEKVRKTSKGRPFYIIRGEGEMREMDCVDCHNRAGHEFKGAGRLADELLDRGAVDHALPYAKLVTIKALEAAARGPRELIGAAISSEIMSSWPREATAENIVQRISVEAKRYLYPRMRIGWEAYKDQNRHSRDEGCFRCHNQRMKDENGDNLTQDCDYCHETIADRIPMEQWRERLVAKKRGEKDNSQ